MGYCVLLSWDGTEGSLNHQMRLLLASKKCLSVMALEEAILLVRTMQKLKLKQRLEPLFTIWMFSVSTYIISITENV